jgi:hypothetical protein
MVSHVYCPSNILRTQQSLVQHDSLTTPQIKDPGIQARKPEETWRRLCSIENDVKHDRLELIQPLFTL